MKICQEHWEKLRAAVKNKGLEHLVHKTGESAFESVVENLQGSGDEKKNFDPLMGANFAIWGQYVNDVGLAAFSNPDICPLCEVEKSKPGLAENWIDGSTEDQLNQARKLGLVQGSQ